MKTILEHANVKEDINADIISANEEESTIQPVPIEIKNKFMYQFFSSIEECTVGKQDNINVAMITAESKVELAKKLSDIGINMFKAYNEFLEVEMKINPKLLDRSIMYESESKDTTLFIRWV